MNRDEREIFKGFQNEIKEDITFRCGDSNECLASIINSLTSLYKENRDEINFKLAIKNLNNYAEGLNFITDDKDLFKGSFKIEGCFEKHIFGSVRNIVNAGYDLQDIWYTSEDLNRDIALKMCLNDKASRLVTYILVDAYANGLINVDIRNNQPARNILNDINYILNYIKNNICYYENIINIMSFLTLNKFDVIDVINSYRYKKDSSSVDNILGIIAFDGSVDYK